MNPVHLAVIPDGGHSLQNIETVDNIGTGAARYSVLHAAHEVADLSVTLPNGNLLDPQRDLPHDVNEASLFTYIPYDVSDNNVQTPIEAVCRTPCMDSLPMGSDRELQGQREFSRSESPGSGPRAANRHKTRRSSVQGFQQHKPSISKKKHRPKQTALPSHFEKAFDDDLTQNSRATSDKNKDALLQIYSGLCSPASVISLLHTLQTLRKRDFATLPFPSEKLSKHDRYQAIEGAENTINSLVLLKRLHILRLWEEHQPEAVLHPGWVSFEGPRDLNPSKPKRPGNPRNLEESEAARSLAQAISSGSPSGVLDSETLLPRAKMLRRLGKRLTQLKEQFGDGILALMSCSDTDSVTQPSLLCSDSMYV